MKELNSLLKDLHVEDRDVESGKDDKGEEGLEVMSMAHVTAFIFY